MFDLSDDQIAVLLLELNRPVITTVRNKVVWVGPRPHRVRDLFTLRTAGLVKPAEIVTGRNATKFELTDRSVAEARRRAPAT